MLTRNEVKALEALVKAINVIVRDACTDSTSNITYVDVYERFRGKGCKGKPEWLNCVVLNNLKVEQSFHPNEAGNQAYAEEVIRSL